MDIQGKGYGGGKGTTSGTSTELIVPIPNYSYFRYYELSLLNTQDCTLLVNGKYTVPVKANVGFQMNSNDAPITSLIISESAIDYQWQGKFV